MSLESRIIERIAEGMSDFATVTLVPRGNTTSIPNTTAVAILDGATGQTCPFWTIRSEKRTSNDLDAVVGDVVGLFRRTLKKAGLSRAYLLERIHVYRGKGGEDILEAWVDVAMPTRLKEKPD